MAFNKIGGGSALPPALPVGLAAGEVFALPAGQGLVGAFGSVAAPQLSTSNPLSGQFIVELGLYSVLQLFDQALDCWRNVNVAPHSLVTVSSDGTNYRIANTTGSPVGAVITALGSAGTDGFYGYNAAGVAVTIQNGVTTLGNTVFTVSTTGGALWNAIVGGQVSTTISLSGTGYANLANWYVAGAPSFTINAGSGYTRPPLVVFTPPPNQGNQPYVLPVASCTISAGAINAITVLQAGAGLLGLPGITIIPQSGDTTGGGAVLGWTSGNGTEQNAGKCVSLLPTFPGTAQTSVPSFTFGGTSNPAPTATVIMNFSLTSITNTTPGAGYGNNITAVFAGGITAGADLSGNPFLNKNLSLPVWPPLSVTNGTGVSVLASGFGGVNIQAVPTIVVVLNNTTVQSTVAVQTPVLGGNTDMIMLYSI